MRSLISPVRAPLYSPTQARSDCSASRSPCAMALAVSSGVCSAGGLIRTVATDFGLVPAVEGAVICAMIWARADPPAARNGVEDRIMNIKVAASHDLMTNPGGDCKDD